jgi:hypothetical protein
MAVCHIWNSHGHKFQQSLAISCICHSCLTSCRAGYCAWDSACILFRLSQMMIRVETSHGDNWWYPLLLAEELSTGRHFQVSFSITDFRTRMEHNLHHYWIICEIIRCPLRWMSHWFQFFVSVIPLNVLLNRFTALASQFMTVLRGMSETFPCQ